MIVPIKLVKLDEDYSSTPFGDYDYNHSYIVITSSGLVNSYYANFLDSAGYGVKNVKSDAVSKKSIEKIKSNEIVNVSTYSTCKNNKFEINDTVFMYNSKEYSPCEYRVLETASNECSNNNDLPIIIMCEL